MAPRGPKMAPRWLQDGPRWLQEAPRWPQAGPTSTSKTLGKVKVFTQVGPKVAPTCPKMAQDGPRWLQEGPRWPQVVPKMAPRWPQRAPRWLQDGPKGPQDGPKLASRWLQDGPRWLQDGSKRPQDGPKIPSWSQKPNKCRGGMCEALRIRQPLLAGARGVLERLQNKAGFLQVPALAELRRPFRRSPQHQPAPTSTSQPAGVRGRPFLATLAFNSLQVGSGWPQDGSRWLQAGFKLQDNLNMTPRWLQDGPKTALRWPQDGLRDRQNCALASTPCIFC